MDSYPCPCVIEMLLGNIRIVEFASCSELLNHKTLESDPLTALCHRHTCQRSTNPESMDGYVGTRFYGDAGSPDSVGQIRVAGSFSFWESHKDPVLNLERVPDRLLIFIRAVGSSIVIPDPLALPEKLEI